MKRVFLFFLLVSITVFYSCDKISHKEILYKAESVVEQYPDSALLLLKEMGSPRNLTGDKQAQYGWIQGMAHDKKGRSLINDSLLVHSLYYFKYNQDTIKTRSLYKLVSKYYYEKEDYDKNSNLLEEGIRWAKEIKDSTAIAQFYILKAMLISIINRDSTEVELNLRNSIQYKKTADAYYRLSWYFTGTDSFYYFSKKSVELALNAKDTTSAVHYLRDMATGLSLFKKYDEAKGMFQQALSLSPTNPSALLCMCYLYMDLEDVDSTEYYLNKTKESFFLLKNQGYTITNTGENMVAIAQAVIDYNHNKQFNYSDIIKYNDSLFLATHDQYKKFQANIESNYNLERENMQLAIHQQQTRFWLMSVIFFVVILGIAIGLYIYKRKQKLLEAEEKIEVLDHLLKEAMANTNNEKDSRFLKKILLQQLGFIRLVAAVPTSANQELLKQMANISDDEVQTDSLIAWDDLYPVIDSIYDNFYSTLIKHYGNVLIEKEIHLCCLLRAYFTTKEIYVVTQQSIPTIYQRKTTIRKKLKIGEKEDIISFFTQKFQA